jgi:drug/metabolite transporter (DMT)-like permease
LSGTIVSISIAMQILLRRRIGIAMLSGIALVVAGVALTRVKRSPPVANASA